jgi:CubicO group peptidase (beta-lactamase class C family)
MASNLAFPLAFCSAVALMADPGTEVPARTSGHTPLHPKTASELANAITTFDQMILAEYGKDNLAGLTVGVVSGSELVWSKSYGLADIQGHRPATSDTVYRIGSITKQFTALMLLQLAAASKVNLSDPVEKYFPEVNQIPKKYPAAAPITLVQLATHTSGLGREPEATEKFATGPIKGWEEALIAALPKLSYEEEPGTHFLYSNIGYAILGVALSRAAGEPYTKYVREHIFVPLGMANTTFDPDEHMTNALAKGYIVHNGVAEAEVPARELRNGRGYKIPNGGVFSTVKDLARFVAFEMGEGPESVLKKSIWLDNLSRLHWATEDLNRGCGVGFMVFRKRDMVAVGQPGSLPGFSAGAYFNPPSHIGIIFLRNAEGHGFELATVLSALEMIVK